MTSQLQRYCITIATRKTIAYPFSDHCATFAIFEAFRTKTNEELHSREIRLFMNMGWQNLFEEFDITDWITLVYNDTISIEMLELRKYIR